MEDNKALFQEVNFEKAINTIIDFIHSFAGGHKIVMGLSGGIDSSVSCALASRAIGAENVKVVIVKNSQFTKEGIDTAKLFAQKLGVDVHEVSSEGLTETIASNLSLKDMDLILKATIDVRICDLLIRTVAQTEQRLYMGTINGTERLVGWYPKGALIGDFCPIGGLLKHQLKGIAKYLELDELVESISNDASIVCGGCGELQEFKGIPYETLDTILYRFEKNGYKASTHVEQTILDRINHVSHKRYGFSQYPKINLEE